VAPAKTDFFNRIYPKRPVETGNNRPAAAGGQSEGKSVASSSLLLKLIEQPGLAVHVVFHLK
jgi:hypothetical protein